MDEMEWWIEKARELRTAIDTAERAFFEHLRAFEATDLWQTQAPTFDRLLDDFDICKPARYRNGCRALDEIDGAVIDEVGMHAAIAVMRCEGSARNSALHEMQLAAAKNGVVLSSQASKRIVSRYVPPQSALLRTEGLLAKLRREIAKLRRENVELRRQLKALLASAEEAG